MMTNEQLQAEIARLKAENAALTRAKPSGSIKISSKGGVSVYGLGRFPVTLYASQWQSLAQRMPEVEAFILANVEQLATKEKAEVPA